MPSKKQPHNNEKESSKRQSPKPSVKNSDIGIHPATIIQRAKLDPSSLPPRDILQLQRTIGNQAVMRLLQANHESLEADPDRTSESVLQQDFTQIPSYPKGATKLQPRLMVNVPGGLQGRRADLGAEQVGPQAAPEPEEASSYDQRLSKDLFEEREVGPESVDGEARKGVEPYYSSYSRNEKGPGKFEDYPSRQLSDNSPINWKATLALVGVEQRENRLEAYEVLTYGFKLSPEKPLTESQLANREKPFHKVDPIYPKQDWSEFEKHRSIVEAAFPNWEYSLLKAKAGNAEKALLRLLLEINPVEDPQNL